MRAPGFTKRDLSCSMISLLRGKTLNLIKRYYYTAVGCTCFQENSALGGLARSLLRKFTRTRKWRLKIRIRESLLKSMANA